MKVLGYCPMGCGKTLMLAPSGRVMCSKGDSGECPNPFAVGSILQDPETEHVVLIGEEGFSVQHPLRERIDGALFECRLHQELTEAGGPPGEPGRYRVTRHQADAYSESYRSGPCAGWDFEALT